VLQSPWWTEHQQRRIERLHRDRERHIDERHFLTSRAGCGAARLARLLLHRTNRRYPRTGWLP
jgi:hypothetical protein